MNAASVPALIATVVVVGRRDRLEEAADALAGLGGKAAVRSVLIAEGDDAAPTLQESGETVRLEGLKAEYLNNAVAALRLSSLPSLVWWRGGSTAVLPGLARLADRLVLDVEDPSEVWRRVPALARRTAVTDLRWTRLTRWRALMAHFFDMDAVRESESRLSSLRIEAGDAHSARLFAGWLIASLPHGAAIETTIVERPGGAPIESVWLGDGGSALTLRLAASRTCVESTVDLPAHTPTTRVVSLGQQHLTALLAEELRIRSRDLAFERAVRTACSAPRSGHDRGDR